MRPLSLTILSVLLIGCASAYSGFSPVQRFTLSTQNLVFTETEQSKTITLKATDGAIYNTYYTSFNDGHWSAHNFSENANKGWITAGSATTTITIPKSSSMENYIIIYSCSRPATAWDCHDGWQIRQVNTSIEQAEETPPTTGNIYYVDFTTGSDSNPGTEEQPLKHHPWMSDYTGAVTLRPGDTVSLKRGERWVKSNPSKAWLVAAQSGSKEEGHITTNAYGTGEKPLLAIDTDSSQSVIQILGKSFLRFDGLDIEHWSKHYDSSQMQNGIVFAESGGIVPHDITITNCDIHSIPFNAINGDDDAYNIIVGDPSATARATNTNYSNHIYDCGYAGVMLLGTNEEGTISNFQVYHNYIHDLEGHPTNDNAYGIAFTAATDSHGWPVNAIAKYNRIENVPTWEGIDSHGGTNISVIDNYIYNCKTAIPLFAASRAGHPTAVMRDCLIEDNTIEAPGNHPSSYHICITVSSENVEHRAEGCIIRNNTCFYTSRPSSETSSWGIRVHTIDGTLIEQNKIYNGPLGSSQGGILIGWDASNKAKNVQVRNNFIQNWDPGVKILARSIDGDIIINNNLINSHGQASYIAVGTATGDISLYNNVLLSAPNAWHDVLRAAVTDIPSGSALTLKNNIIGYSSPATTSSLYLYVTGTISGTIAADHNLYWNSARTNPFSIAGTSYTWEQWTASGRDAHGLDGTDPQFVNAGGTYLQETDYELQSTSPAIDAGVDVGLPYNGAAPDLGPFETEG